MHFMTSHKHIVDILIPITSSHNCNIDIWNYNCDYPKLYLWKVKKKVLPYVVSMYVALYDA